MPTTDLKTVLLVAAPRTGSNYLLNLLAHRPDIYVRHEVFHPEQAFGFDGETIERFSELLGQRFAGPADPRLVAALARHPFEAVAALRESARMQGASLCVLKIFPGHGGGSLDAVQKLLPVVDRVGFVKRRLIDSYISVVKAEAIREFFGIDTTALRPTLDCDHFLRWHEYTSAWYIESTIGWIRHARSSDVPVLKYEDFTAADNDSNLRCVERWLQEQVGIPVGISGRHVSKGALSRQDRGGSGRQKVANYDQFLESLRPFGLDECLDRYF